MGQDNKWTDLFANTSTDHPGVTGQKSAHRHRAGAHVASSLRTGRGPAGPPKRIMAGIRRQSFRPFGKRFASSRIPGGVGAVRGRGAAPGVNRPGSLGGISSGVSPAAPLSMRHDVDLPRILGEADDWRSIRSRTNTPQRPATPGAAAKPLVARRCAIQAASVADFTTLAVSAVVEFFHPAVAAGQSGNQVTRALRQRRSNCCSAPRRSNPAFDDSVHAGAFCAHPHCARRNESPDFWADQVQAQPRGRARTCFFFLMEKTHFAIFKAARARGDSYQGRDRWKKKDTDDADLDSCFHTCHKIV